MAGLCEVCTHVAAILFYLETSARLHGKTTCTQEQCQWVIPSYQKDIPYAPVRELDFTSAKGKRDRINAALSDPLPTKLKRVRKSPSVGITPPDDTKIEQFYRTLSKCGTKPAVLSVVLPYAKDYEPKSSCPIFPKPLPELYEEKYLKMNYMELLNASDTTEITITAEMAVAVEKATTNQSSSKLWFKYRAGRVTASRMKAVCHTDPANPAQSLIKSICYPEVFKFSSKATSWGCKHEKSARDRYMMEMVGKHDNFSVKDSGLVLNAKWSHIGASPDGIVNCKCCNNGVVEIKCPYCHRNDNIHEAVTQDKKFCLKPNSDGTLILDRTHAYYYQIQTQIFVCVVEYCDFVVCTFPENGEPQIVTERIFADHDLWSQCVTKSTEFFKVCILPELLGRWYTRPCINVTEPETSAEPDNPTSTIALPGPSGLSDPSETESDATKLYCYCQQPEHDEMIACDYSNCKYEWFHIECLKIKTVPKGKWFCPTCRKLPECKRVSKKKRQE